MTTTIYTEYPLHKLCTHFIFDLVGLPFVLPLQSCVGLSHTRVTPKSPFRRVIVSVVGGSGACSSLEEPIGAYSSLKEQSLEGSASALEESLDNAALSRRKRPALFHILILNDQESADPFSPSLLESADFHPAGEKKYFFLK